MHVEPVHEREVILQPIVSVQETVVAEVFQPQVHHEPIVHPSFHAGDEHHVPVMYHQDVHQTIHMPVEHHE